jgi:hypothetical protein
MKKPDAQKIFGLISVCYGTVFIILDKIDYAIQIERYEGVLSQGYPEPLMMRIPNLIFSIALILAGYFLVKKEKEKSWYLFNFSFIGVLLKYLFVLFFAIFAIGNFLHSYGIHLIISIFGLYMVNRKKFLYSIQFKFKKKAVSYILITLIASSIISFYGYENMINHKKDRKSHFKELVYNSHLFSNNRVDSSYFAFDFIKTIDTLKNIDIYSQIEILQLDSIQNPVYGERLSIYEFRVLRDFYVYNDSGQLIRKIKDSQSIFKMADTLIYTYYNDDKIKSITELYTPLGIGYHDTMTYHYNYIRNSDTIYYSNNRCYNYSYASKLNDLNNVVETKQIYGIYSSGLIEYDYNSNDQLVKITSNNQKENKQKSIELFFYDEKGLLMKIEKNIYDERKNKLESKELTIIVYGEKLNLNL